VKYAVFGTVSRNIWYVHGGDAMKTDIIIIVSVKSDVTSALEVEVALVYIVTNLQA
jgi:hypothetical protein